MWAWTRRLLQCISYLHPRVSNFWVSYPWGVHQAKCSASAAGHFAQLAAVQPARSRLSEQAQKVYAGVKPAAMHVLLIEHAVGHL